MTTGLAENSSAGFRIRPARRDEAEAIAHLQAVAHAGLYAPPHVDRAAYVRESVDKARKHSWLWRLALVAEESGKILGVAKTAGSSVLALYVDESRHGRGVGTALLAAAEARLRRNGIGIANLLVARGHDAILAFYERRGWQPSAEEPPPEPVWGLRLITMTKQLAAIDARLNRVCGWLLKAALCLAAAAMIFLAQWWLQARGAIGDGEAVATGFLLAIYVFDYTPRLHCENYTVWRNWPGVATAGFLYVAGLVATFAAGALLLQASGLFLPELLDTGSLTVEVTSRKDAMLHGLTLLTLCFAANRAARHAVSLVWRRYVWLFA